MTDYLQQPVQPTPQIVTGAPVAAPLWQARGDGMTLIASYHFLVAALFLVVSLILLLPTTILGIIGIAEDGGALIGMVAVGFVAMTAMVLCLLYLAIGYGLWTLRSWARTGALALAMISLLGIPIGTIAGATTLWYLLRTDIAAKFEERKLLTAS